MAAGVGSAPQPAEEEKGRAGKGHAECRQEFRVCHVRHSACQGGKQQKGDGEHGEKEADHRRGIAQRLGQIERQQEGRPGHDEGVNTTREGGAREHGVLEEGKLDDRLSALFLEAEKCGEHYQCRDEKREARGREGAPFAREIEEKQAAGKTTEEAERPAEVEVKAGGRSFLLIHDEPGQEHGGQDDGHPGEEDGPPAEHVQHRAAYDRSGYQSHGIDAREYPQRPPPPVLGEDGHGDRRAEGYDARGPDPLNSPRCYQMGDVLGKGTEDEARRVEAEAEHVYHLPAPGIPYPRQAEHQALARDEVDHVHPADDRGVRFKGGGQRGQTDGEHADVEGRDKAAHRYGEEHQPLIPFVF